MTEHSEPRKVNSEKTEFTLILFSFFSLVDEIYAPTAVGANMLEWLLYTIYFSVDFCAPQPTVGPFTICVHSMMLRM